jgi:aspartyl-tRNA(Asn)/glutamyl-tRNA(Gln) amidotransferase subunit A
MHEFAFGGPALDAPFPAVRNPWNIDHIPGGSSSGSGAALAAGLCLGALGSDTGGSIRGPASHCGVVGIKPTYGRVSRHGVVPLSWSLDHAGPMARTVEDCALLLQIISGYDASDPASADVSVPDFGAGLRQGIRGVRIGIPRVNWFDELEGVHDETSAVFEAGLEVLRDLGAVLVELDGGCFALARKANQTILVCEAYAYHERRLQQAPELYGSSVRRRILEGAFLSAADYIQAQRARAALNQQIHANFTQVEVFATPTMPRPADSFATLDPDEANRRPNLTNPFNLTGLPAISVPCGFTPRGLPVGMQIATRPFDEALALRAAHAYQQATIWHKHRPPL